MTPKISLNPGLAGGGRAESLNAYAARLCDRPVPMLALIEMKPVDKVVPVDPSSEKDPHLRLAISTLEVAAPGEQERLLRDVLRGMNLARTADGTLDADNDIKLGEQTLQNAPDLIAGEQVARLVVIIDWILGELAKVASDEKLRPVDVRKVLGQVADRAAAARLGVQGKDGPAW